MQIIQPCLDNANPESLYPNGFYRFPLSIVRRHGKLARTLAAFWTLREVRQGGRTHAGLDHVAFLTGLPASTQKKHLTKLVEAGAVFRDGKVKVGPKSWKTDYRLSGNVLAAFRNDPWLLVPRHWESSFGESILKAYYFNRCGVWNGYHSYCISSFRKMSKRLGMDRGNLGTHARRLEERGEIIRRHCGQLVTADFAVSIPGFEPAYPLRDVLSGKRKGQGLARSDQPQDLAIPYGIDWGGQGGHLAGNDGIPDYLIGIVETPHNWSDVEK